MPNRIEARSAKAALTNATGRLPLLRLFSTPLVDRGGVWKMTPTFLRLLPNTETTAAMIGISWTWKQKSNTKF